MIILDLVHDGTSEAVGARPETEALLNQPAGELIQLRNAAGASYPAAVGPPIHLDRKRDTDLPSDPRIAQAPGIIPREDIATDLLELGPPAVSSSTSAIPDATRSSARAAADGGTSAGAATRRWRGGADRDDRFDGGGLA